MPNKLLGVDVMTAHWEMTYGAKRVQEIVDNDFKGHIDFIAQNIKTADFGDPVFEPYTMKEMNGVRVGIIGQAFPYTPIANPRYFVPDWSFGIQEENMQKMVDEVRGKGAQVVVLLSHNGMDVDLKLASRVRGIDAILGGHTHDGVPQPTLVKNAGGTTLVSNAGSNGKFLAVLDFDVKGGKVSDYRYKLLPVFANLLPADAEMSAYIAANARTVRGAALGKTRGHRRAAVSPRQLQRHVRPADLRRVDAGTRCGNRVFARISLGYVAPPRPGDSDGTPDGSDGDHVPAHHG